MNDYKSEPQFNVVHEDRIINCIQGKDNFFFAAVVYLYYTKTISKSLTERIRIDDFINMIIS